MVTQPPKKDFLWPWHVFDRLPSQSRQGLNSVAVLALRARLAGTNYCQRCQRTSWCHTVLQSQDRPRLPRTPWNVRHHGNDHENGHHSPSACRLLLEGCIEICSSHPPPTTSRNIEISPRGGGRGDCDGGATSSREVGTSSSCLCPRLAWVVLLAFYSSYSVEQRSRMDVVGCLSAKWRRRCVADACGRVRNSSTAASLLVRDAKRLRMLVRWDDNFQPAMRT